MSKKARRTSYKEWITEDGLLKIEGWARDGLTDEQIAEKIGIARGTIYAWKKNHPNIDDALKKGKEVVDRQVENALLKRALGYEYEEVKKIQEKDANGKDRVRVEKTIKTVAPDVSAQIFWLKNRKPEKFRNNTEATKRQIEAQARKLEAEAIILENHADKLSQSGQVNDLLESLIQVVDEDD